MSNEFKEEIKEENHRQVVIAGFWVAVIAALAIKPIYTWSGAAAGLHTPGAVFGGLCCACAALIACGSGVIGFAASCRYAIRYGKLLWQGPAAICITGVLLYFAFGKDFVL
jgi:hypothetical protein